MIIRMRQCCLLLGVILLTSCNGQDQKTAIQKAEEIRKKSDRDKDFEMIAGHPIDGDPAKIYNELTPLITLYKTDLPFKVDMTTKEVEEIIKILSDEKNNDKGKYQAILLDKQIADGDGYFSLLLGGKGDCWIDLSIDKGKIKNIWLMIGGMEINSGMYHRIEGAGPRRGVLNPTGLRPSCPLPKGERSVNATPGI